MKQTKLAEEYVRVFNDIELRLDSESEWSRRLDVLWYAMDQEEVDWTEHRLDEMSRELKARESLRLVDVVVDELRKNNFVREPEQVKTPTAPK